MGKVGSSLLYSQPHRLLSVAPELPPAPLTPFPCQLGCYLRGVSWLPQQPTPYRVYLLGRAGHVLSSRFRPCDLQLIFIMYASLYSVAFLIVAASQHAVAHLPSADLHPSPPGLPSLSDIVEHASKSSPGGSCVCVSTRMVLTLAPCRILI